MRQYALWVWAGIVGAACVVGVAMGALAHVHMTTWAFLLHAIFLCAACAWTREVLTFGALPALQLSLAVLAVVHVIMLRDTTILQVYLGADRQWYDYAGLFMLFHLALHVVPVVSALVVTAAHRRLIHDTLRHIIRPPWPWLVLDACAFALPLGAFAVFADLAAEYGYTMALPDMLVVISAAAAVAMMVFAALVWCVDATSKNKLHKDKV